MEATYSIVLPEGYFLPSSALKRATFCVLVAVTVMVQVAVLSSAWAVIVAVPGAIALTTPFLQTVATAALSVLKVTSASAGVTVAKSSNVSPRYKVAEVLLSMREVTSLGWDLIASGPQEVKSPSVRRAREKYR